ncbi:hypothetical protein C8F04DRAFT_1296110 [Mycena alexandri]|uniref:Zn(2)-C6 fungal-type domain-containing protein n=1 Tax=Mycena alexandri TaxID=1745969 RepID=A0AAD6WVI7_9AGAR|nr:hypothetical protein C8F04DRAFT_1296110 [Mycena alexandri]
MADCPNRPQHLPAVFLNRRRNIIACTNCRKRKIRCLTPEEPPENPCERCVKRGLRCEYITVANQQGSAKNKGEAEHTSKRSSRSQSPPATYPGVDGVKWHEPRPRRSYSAPNPAVKHYPYAQYSRPSSGYAYHADGGGYNEFASSMEFQGYVDPAPTLPPIATVDFGLSPALGYGRGVYSYTAPDRAQQVFFIYRNTSWLTSCRCAICLPGLCQCQWTRN